MAGETSFVVHLEGMASQAAPAARVVPDSRADRRPPASVSTAAQYFGHWVCAPLSGDWTKIDNGFRLTAEGRFPAMLIFVEAPAPEHMTLEQIAQTQAEQFCKAMPGATAEGPASAQVVGADEALQLTLRHPRFNNFALVQRCVFARRKGVLGTSMLLTSDAELHLHMGEFAKMLDGAALTDFESGRSGRK